MRIKLPLLALILVVTVIGVRGQNLWGTVSSGLQDNKGALFKTASNGTGYAVQYQFKSEFPGSQPYNKLLLASNGKLYGTTSAGGTSGIGSLFQYDPGTGVLTTLAEFTTPEGSYAVSALTEVSGVLYGMAYQGGANGFGTIFKYNSLTTGGTLSTVYDFDNTNGSNPLGSLLYASNGKLYGVTSGGGTNTVGVFFELNPTGDVFSKKIDFTASTGSSPYCDLVEISGKVYGTTSAGGLNSNGVLFEVNLTGFGYADKYDFTGGSDGSAPLGGLIASGTVLTGTTSAGGANGGGVIFSFDLSNTTFTKLADFSSSLGSYPQGSLLKASDNNIYGFTTSGGAHSLGTFFKYSGGIITNLQDMDATVIGYPYNGNAAIEVSGVLYTLQAYGGPFGNGGMYKYVLASPGYTKVFDFGGSLDGSNPQGSLTRGSQLNVLYGTTQFGGANGQGVFFEYNQNTSTYTKKGDFSSALGFYPSGGVTEVTLTAFPTYPRLYGLTQQGGTNGDGTIFEFSPQGDYFNKVFDFSSATTGSNPVGNMVLASDGILYGVTKNGGASGVGTLFQFDANTYTYTKKADFNVTNGSNPTGDLIQAANGKLYGLASGGGSSSAGTLFEYNIATGTLAKKIDFTGPNGDTPYGGLTQATNGMLYGLTSSGGGGVGVLFVYNPTKNVLVVKNQFSFTTTGSAPYGSLTEVAPGKFYGTTSGGGTNSGGVIFQYDSIAGTLTKLTDLGGSLGTSPQYVRPLLVPAKQSQTITFNALPAKAVTDAPFTLSATASSGLPVTYVSSDPSIASVSGNTVTIHTYGNVTITASQYGDGTWSYALDKSQVLTITRASQTITFTLASPVTFAPSMIINLNGSASSGLTVTYTSSNPAVATITGSVLNVVGAGTTIVTASQAGNANYNPAPDVQQTLLVNQATQTISFVIPPAHYVYNTGPYTLTASASSGLPVSFTSLDVTNATASGNQLTILHRPAGGSVSVQADQSGNTSYLAAPSATQTLFIDKATQTMTFVLSPNTKTFGDAPFTLSGSATSGLALTYSSSDPIIASISGNTVTILKAGLVTITATQPGNGDYNAATDPLNPPNAFINQTLTINQGGQSITFNPLSPANLGDPPITLTATASSGLPVSYSSSNTGVATVSGNILTVVGAGTSTITASQAGDGNYTAATPVQQVLTVKQGQTITFGPLADKSVGDSPFTLTATASSGLIVTYTSSNTAVATISGNTVTIVGAGSTNITASQPGDAVYNPAPPVVQPLVVRQGQSITFGPLPAKTYGDLPFTLSASASSGLAVTYSSDNLSVATISGNTLTIVAPGTANITASQPGNALYNPATPVTQPLTVAKASQVIILGFFSDPVVGGPDVSVTATASSGLPVTLASLTPLKFVMNGNAIHVVSAGTSTIRASQDGNAYYSAATIVDRNFCIDPARPVITVTNPSSATPVLNSSASEGNQWYLNGTKLVGGTLQVLTATQSGVYAVSSTIETCTSQLSLPYNLTITGDLPLTIVSGKIFPNPVKDKLYVDLREMDEAPSRLRILDLTGRTVIEQSVKGGQSIELNVSGHAPGMYLLMVEQDQKLLREKYLKE
ncbi:MAG: T9SS type A sorting domain-containing protein [Bacteroidetes bacterium]|nr:T9SS type A sorting domain-containing protein [Bacteroidota bacterium]